jgi:soluble lytic murein transglycosylase-like protein
VTARHKKWLIKYIVLTSVLIVGTLFGNEAEVIAEPAPEVVAEKVEEEKPKSVDELIALYAKEYGVSEAQLRGTIKCESGFNPNAHNKSDPQGGAKGIAQYLQPTFNGFVRESGFTDMDVWDAEDSIKLTAWAFSRGYQHHWTCWRNLYGKI